MDLGIASKRALVLASSQGLGLSIATALCAEGTHVLLASRNAGKLEKSTSALNKLGPGKASFVQVDLNDADAAHVLFHAANEQLGGVDILVNNTGGPPPGAINIPDEQQWHTYFGAMVVGIMQITHLCVPAMIKANWGRILTIASSGVLQPLPNLGMSNALRAALVGWNKTLSNEVAMHGITANIIAPGRIHTERVDQLDAAAAERLNKPIEEVIAASKASIPAGRYGRSDEFGALGAFLVSECASYVNGSVIRCDGGAVKGV